MSERLTHEQYVEQERHRVLEVARLVVSGEISIIEGSHFLSCAATILPLCDDDADLQVFKAISSETDALPVGDIRQHWSRGALVEKDREIERVERLYSEYAIAACKSIIRRFGNDVP